VYVVDDTWDAGINKGHFRNIFTIAENSFQLVFPSIKGRHCNTRERILHFLVLYIFDPKMTGGCPLQISTPEARTLQNWQYCVFFLYRQERGFPTKVQKS